jgi:hypothetical protein
MVDQDNIEVRVARSVPEVEALREPWMGWPGHRDSDIDFYLMILQAYPEMLRPHVVAIYRGGKPEAILVGRLDKKKVTFNVGYIRGVGSWARCLTFVYGAIHGNASPENTQILVDEVLNSLKRDEADVALLEFVPLESDLYRIALTAPRGLCRDTLPASQGHEILVVPDSIDEIYRRMSGTRREGIRRGIRKFLARADGKARIECYRRESEFDVLFRDAEEIAKKTYQRGLGAGFATTPEVRERLGLAARKGWLRAYLLYVDDCPVAFWIGTIYNKSFASEYLGYDPKFRQFSPGMFLIMRVIEGFCTGTGDDVVKELDFGLGDAEYKAALCSRGWLEASVYIFAPTLKGIGLKGMRATARAVDGAARKLLVSTNLLPRLKRLWRDRLRRGGQPAAAAPGRQTS